MSDSNPTSTILEPMAPIALHEKLETLPIKPGVVVQAKVVSADANTIVFELEGETPLKATGNPATFDVLGVGEKLAVYIDDVGEDFITARGDKAKALALWDKLTHLLETDDNIDALVLAVARNGLSVDIGVKALMPASEIDTHFERDLHQWVGQTVPVRVLRFDERKGVVVSRRAAIEERVTAQKAVILAELKEGDVVNGVVKSLVKFGAFVDLGGVDALLHVSDMSWSRVRSPSAVVAVGERIEVKVLQHDIENEKIRVGLKQLKEDPWHHADRRFRGGDRVKGPIVSLTKFGAFIAVESGIEGMCHVSEISWNERINAPGDVLSIGQVVEATVMHCDPAQQRLKLSIKRALENPWAEAKKKYAVGTRLLGPVRSVTDFGVFVGIEEGIDGLVHVSDIAWTRSATPKGLYTVGQEVEVMVLGVDVDRERLSLGIKQLTADDSAQKYAALEMGQQLSGKVARMRPFGAFIDLEDGVEGLCRLADMGGPARPEDVLKIGQKAQFTVVQLDAKSRRLGLALVIEKSEETAPNGVEAAQAEQKVEVSASAQSPAQTEESAPKAKSEGTQQQPVDGPE